MAKAIPAGSGRIGRYALVDRLAIGGMAEVFLAREVDGLDRLVVVKRMLPALAEDAEFVSMFLREAQIVARISHPNVVQILERGEADGLPFFAMAYVPGVSFKELVKAARLRSGLLPLGLVVHLLAQACAGAHAAHELRLPSGEPVGLVHRDLTPHNLMVDDQAHVKLLDFGIAKDAAVDGGTRTGVLRGKISYLSPEQALQLPLDRRTDVFALGVCAYELITLDRPFTMQSEAQTIQRIVEGRYRPLGDLRPEVPLGLADVVHRALSRDLERRWPTAEAFRMALKTEALAWGIDDDADSARRALRPILGTMVTERNAQLYAAIQRVGPGNATASLYGVSGSTSRSVAASPRAGWMAPVLAGAGLAASVAVSAATLVSAAGLTAWWTLTGPSGPPLSITFAPVHSAHTVLAEHDPILRYLEGRLDRPIAADVAGSYADAVTALGSGEAALAVLPGKAVDHALAEVPGVEVLAWKVVDGSAESQGLLLVASDSRAASLADLRGERVCLTDPDSVTGWELPMRYARAHDIDLARDLTVHASGNHEKALTDLLAGTCAVAATYSGNLMTANERGIPVSRLKILVPTGTTPNDAIVAGPAADAALRDAVREALASFDPARDAGMERVGAVERITGFRLPHAGGGDAP